VLRSIKNNSPIHIYPYRYNHVRDIPLCPIGVSTRHTCGGDAIIAAKTRRRHVFHRRVASVVVLSCCAVLTVRANGLGKDTNSKSRTANAKVKLANDREIAEMRYITLLPSCCDADVPEGRWANDDVDSDGDGRAWCRPYCPERNRQINVEVRPQFTAIAVKGTTHS
jgi:hypothetical protein